MYRKRAALGRKISILLLIILALGVLFPFGAWAQGGRQMRLNHVETTTWPDVTLNMTLAGPDGKAVNDLNPAQFQVTENGKAQSIVGLAMGLAHDVPLSVVLAIDVSGS